MSKWGSRTSDQFTLVSEKKTEADGQCLSYKEQYEGGGGGAGGEGKKEEKTGGGDGSEGSPKDWAQLYGL